MIDIGTTAFFVLEAILKIIAFGFVFGKRTYLMRDGFNRLDFIIVLVSC